MSTLWSTSRSPSPHQPDRPSGDVGPARASGDPGAEPGGAYHQPTPQLLYVHDDLTDLVIERFGERSDEAVLARSLLELVGRDPARVGVLTLREQIEGVVDQGAHAPFDLTIGIGRAGQRVARALHARTGWFPRVVRVGVTREEDGRGGYDLASTEPQSLADQLADLDGTRVAIVDDTVFSGLTMRGVLEALPASLRSRAHAFCLRGVAESIASIAQICPITAGVSAPGRLLEDVSFINASGLVLRVAIRRRGQVPMAFFERPEWIRAWFPGACDGIVDLCRRLNRALEEQGDRASP